MNVFNSREISTEKLFELIRKSQVKIVDVRSSDAYNGWKFKNEFRGGHITGAKSLPVKWTRYMDWIEIVRSKQILPNDTVIVYGDSQQDIIKVSELFIKAKYNNVFTYNNFIEEWANNFQLPMDNLSRYKNLVPASWVKSITKGEIPTEHNGGNTVICHSHYRNRDAYLTGHIPGAIDLDTLALENPRTWNRRTADEIKSTLKQHGITSDTTVILYGKYMTPNNADDFPGSSAGHIGAIRNAFIMMYAGVKDVRVLNGGYQSWLDAGYDISYNDVEKVEVKNFGITIPDKPELAVDVPKAKEMIASPDCELVCVRSWSEYIGEVSGYNYIEKKGRIPGAIFGNCGSDAYHMENYRNVDHTIREAQEVESTWKNVGITPNKHIAFYCGTGWRGSEAFYNAWLMGWPNISVFDGGWFEWSNDPKNKYETGQPIETVTSES